jgi:2'-5' RNA ligase
LCEQFDWLEPGDDRVEPERLHVTLVRIPVWPGDMDDTIARACCACATLQAAPFRVVMDELVVADRVVLKPSEPVRALSRFQFGLRNALADVGLVKRRSKAWGAHLTVSYRTRSERRAFVPPVSWTVRDFVLIESLVGERRQIERGRWALQGPIRTSPAAGQVPLANLVDRVITSV